MTEDDFDRLIDCRFPYRDEGAWKRLIGLGRGISSNAHFRTLHEICRPPRSAEVTPAEQRAMLQCWADGFDDPVKDVVMECAAALIARRDLAVADVLRIMDRIALCNGAYAALSIACFACEDVDGRAAARFDAITGEWRRTARRG